MKMCGQPTTRQAALRPRRTAPDRTHRIRYSVGPKAGFRTPYSPVRSLDTPTTKSQVHGSLVASPCAYTVQQTRRFERSYSHETPIPAAPLAALAKNPEYRK